MKQKRGDWITNHPVSIRGYWPRRACRHAEGSPKATDHSSSADLTFRGIVGIYLDENLCCDIRELPLAANQRSWDELIKIRHCPMSIEDATQLAKELDEMEKTVTDWEADFLQSMISRCAAGLPLSEKQESVLRRMEQQYL